MQGSGGIALAQRSYLRVAFAGMAGEFNPTCLLRCSAILVLRRLSPGSLCLIGHQMRVGDMQHRIGWRITAAPQQIA